MSGDRQLQEASNEQQPSLHLAEVLPQRTDLVRKSVVGCSPRTGSPIPKPCHHSGMEIDETRRVMTLVLAISLQAANARCGAVRTKGPSARPGPSIRTDVELSRRTGSTGKAYAAPDRSQAAFLWLCAFADSVDTTPTKHSRIMPHPQPAFPPTYQPVQL